MIEDESIYQEEILDHYSDPHNNGRIENSDIKHQELNTFCGDEITIFLSLEDKKVREVKFVGRGCAISQASISMLTDKIKGMSLDEIKNIKREEVLDLLGIEIGPVRMKCALLGLKTFIKGIEKHEGKDE